MNKVKFSVVIPTCHRNDLLAKCLDCLKSDFQTLSADEYEVIVTDDGSKFTAQEMLSRDYPWVKWVAGTRKGPAANRNNGAKHAQADWIVFTDDDCLPDKNWLASYRSAIEDSVSALEGSIHPVGNIKQDLADCPINLQGGAFWSANIAIRRSLFEQIKGFDETYPLAAHEDQDLKIRVEQHTPIKFVPEAKILHPVRIVSLADRLKRIPKRAKALAYHANKHKKETGYENLSKAFVTLYKFHLITLSRNIRSAYFQQAFFSVVMLCFGIPLILMQFSRISKRGL